MIRIIGKKNLETPAFIPSYRIKDYPRAGLRSHPWKDTNTQAVLLNAFDLLANNRTKMFTADIQKLDGKLHEFIEFRGPIILDSGAYNFLQHDKMSIAAVDVLNIGLEMKADLSVVLDHPFSPNLSPEDIAVRLERTHENTRAMVEALARRNGNIPDGFMLMPVLHGHTAETLQQSLVNIRSALGSEPSIVGIGSLAPLAKNGNTRKAIDVLLEVRRLLPDAHIHCFSMGSALLMLLAFYCGADTVDSQTWIMSAAFKQVQLPGFHITRLSSHEAEVAPVRYNQIRCAFAHHLLHLIHEEGFIVRDWDCGDIYSVQNEAQALDYLDYLEDRDGVNQIHRRACHNLYSFNFEAARVRQEIAAGNLEAFVRRRMTTRYLKSFEYAVHQKQR